MVICDECNGLGYKIQGFILGGLGKTFKIWCERCKGTGLMKWEGDRSGIGWEGE